MNDTQIREAVLKSLGEVAPEADLSRLKPDASLRQQLELDSMDFLNFLVGIDEALGVEVHEADYPKFDTLDGCVAYLKARAGAA